MDRAIAEKTRAATSEFVISRIFAAPRDRVWQAFADVDRMRRWFTPKGFAVTSAKMDFRVGGTYHYCQRSPNGQEMWGRVVYREIAAPERLVWVSSFSDPQGGMSRHPLAPGWPLELLTTITLAEERGKTRLTVRWVPINPTVEERQTFDAGRPSMQAGWSGTLDQLGAHLAAP